MPIEVWDYRQHIQNLVAAPEIRARFAQVHPGPLTQYHSHDLGGEIFLALEGDVIFDVEDERVTLLPGQAIYVPPRVNHRSVPGQRVGTYYLSVTPHVEPTHTIYDEAMHRRPPRYGGWRGAGDPSPRETRTTAELADALVAEADELARRAAATAAALRAQAAALQAAVEVGDQPAAKAAADAMWDAAYPTLSLVRSLEATWNQVAGRSMSGRATE